MKRLEKLEWIAETYQRMIIETDRTPEDCKNRSYRAWDVLMVNNACVGEYKERGHG